MNNELCETRELISKYLHLLHENNKKKIYKVKLKKQKKNK